MMPLNGNSFLKSYLDSNLKLVKTMTIKSITSAESINDDLVRRYGQAGVDLNDPFSWKYYLNISGEYHNLDTPMVVTSLDTLEEITFDKENLKTHTATAQAYGFGSRYYYSLLNKYPSQEQLILGILYPADISVAVGAEDGSILSYPKDLVEDQEQTLIPDLENFIKRHMKRWNVKSFGLSDSLYDTSYHAVLYLSLLPKLMNLRLLRCQTHEAHSFHIREYLASHGRLDKYLPFMTLKQSLYLYRNIRYIERNTGRNEMLDELIGKILTDRQIPIAEYSIRQLSSFDENFYPEIRARRKPLNDQYNVTEMSYLDTKELYDKEDLLVSGNQRYHESFTVNEDRSLKNSRSSVIQTKDLESSMVDYNDAVPDSLEAVLLRQWMSLVSRGKYTAYSSFKDPKTSETRSLFVREALIYFVYVGLRSAGIDVKTVPSFLYSKARKERLPTVQELLSIVDSSLENMKEVAQDILGTQPIVTTCRSTHAFYEQSYAIYEQSKRHWYLLSNTHDMHYRGAIEAMILSLYEDKNVELQESGEDIETWLVRNNLPSYNYTTGQAQELLLNIFNSATGLTFDSTQLLKNIQKNMLALLSELTSYAVQIIREINDSKIRPLNWAAIRFGNMEFDASGQYYVDINNPIQKADVSTENDNVIDMQYSQVVSFENSLFQDISVLGKTTTVAQYSMERDILIPMPRKFVEMSYSDPTLQSAVSSRYFGEERYMALTDAQKQQLKSLYD